MIWLNKSNWGGWQEEMERLLDSKKLLDLVNDSVEESIFDIGFEEWLLRDYNAIDHLLRYVENPPELVNLSASEIWVKLEKMYTL